MNRVGKPSMTARRTQPLDAARNTECLRELSPTHELTELQTTFRYQPTEIQSPGTEARLPRIRLKISLSGRTEALLGYLVTDSDGLAWAFPEISNDHVPAHAVAYQLDTDKIDMTPVAGRSNQFVAYRAVLSPPSD
jgi:hypothetical protein